MSRRGNLLGWAWSPRVLDRKVNGWWCAGAWVLAAVVFVALVAAIGGPSRADDQQSTVAALAIARGEFHCAYPHDEPTPTPPLYPMLAGAVVAAGGLDGPTVNATAGPDAKCPSAAHIFDQITPRGLQRVLWVGVFGWLGLLAGFVALLRAAGRGKSLWECLGVLVFACLVPVIECVASIFHPNDLLAMGLVLGAMACCVSSRWAWGGVLIGAACMTHQFALLVAVPMAVMTLAERRLRLVVAATATAVLIAGTAVVLTGSGVLRAILGEDITPNSDVTWVDHLGLGNDALAVVARMVPLVLAGLLALVAIRRLGRALWGAPLFCALMAMCLGLRLVFEINLLGYRFTAYVVMLVVIDWVNSRVRWVTVAWVAAVSLIWPVSADFHSGVLGDRKLLLQLMAIVTYFLMVAPQLVQACLPDAVGHGTGPPREHTAAG